MRGIGCYGKIPADQGACGGEVFKLAKGDAEGALKLAEGVPAGNYDALAGELRGDALTQLGRADDLRAELARAARRTAETIDWEHVNDSFAEALIRAWRSGTASPPAVSPLRTREAES